MLAEAFPTATWQLQSKRPPQEAPLRGRLVAMASSLQSLGSLSPGSPCPPASFCCSLGRAKGEHVPRVNKGFIPALPATLSHNKISLKTRNSSCPLEMLGSNLSYFTKKLKPFDSQHFLGAQANTLYTEESSFFRLGFLKCCKKKQKKQKGQHPPLL